MYEFIPPKNNKKAPRLVLLFLIGALILFMLTSVMQQLTGRWVIQLVGVALLAAAIYILTRYIGKTFVYAVTEGEGGKKDFTVSELQRKGGRLTVCRISIGGITEAVWVRRSDSAKMQEIKKKIAAGKYKKFNYCPEVAPAESCFLFVEECGEKFAIRICPDETLSALLKP